MNNSSPSTLPRWNPLEKSLLSGVALFLGLMIVESVTQFLPLIKDARAGATPVVAQGLERCAGDVARFFMTVFLLYLAAGLAAGFLAHLGARAGIGERRGFRAIFWLELAFIPCYLAVSMSIWHPIFAVRRFPNFFPVDWITTYTQPWMFHAFLAVFGAVHLALLIRRYRGWIKPHRRLLFGWLAGLGAAAAAVAAIEWTPGLGHGPVVHDPSRPHVFFYCIDALRVDRLQRHHYRRQITPNLDAFMRDAAVFDNVFTPLAKTFPSWVCFLTATDVITNNVRFSLPARERRAVKLPTIAQVLRDRGWHTTFFTDDSRFSYMEDWAGFELIDQPEPGFMNYFANYVYNYLLVGRLANTRIGNFLFPMTRNNHAQSYSWSPRIFYQDLVADIGHRVRQGPLASFTHNVGIHYPGVSPWPYYTLFTDPSYRGVNKYMYRDFTFSDLARQDLGIIKDSNEHNQALYDNMVKMMDDKFGMFLQALEQLGIYDDSLIVVFSDHGEHFNERYQRLRTLPPLHGVSVNDDFSNHCLLAIRFPKSFRPQIRNWTIPELARIQDLAPTVLEALGLPIPPTFEGHSFLPRLQGLAPPPELVVYMERDINPTFLEDPDGLAINVPKTRFYGLDPGARTVVVIEDYAPAVIYAKDRALRTNQWKLVRKQLMSGLVFRLYDIRNDPHQERDLAQQYPEVLLQMKQLMEPYLQADRYLLSQTPEQISALVNRSLQEHAGN